MPFIHFNQKKKVKIWDGISGSLHHSEGLTFGHITIDEGTILPVHHHPHGQWTHLIEGELEFDINGDKTIMQPGTTAFIPPGLPHSARAITRCKVIDCFMPVRGDFAELEKKG